MENSSEVFCLIPARGGSKGLPRKNILDLAGKPLIAHSIDVALATPSIKRVFVSTDDEEIAETARNYGAEVPFLRPPELAKDLTPDFPVFKHFVDYLDSEGIESDLIMHLRPTCPIRRASVLAEAVRDFQTATLADYTSLRSVSIPKDSPFKMWQFRDEELKPLIMLDGVAEPYNEPRQKLPLVYWQNGYVDIYRAKIIRNELSCSGEKIRGFKITDKVFDVDYLSAFNAAETFLNSESEDNDQLELPG